MAAPPAPALLRELHFLRDVEPQDLLQLAGALPRQSFARGAEIVRPGQAADALYVILEGEAELIERPADGPARRVAVLGPGDLIGEMQVTLRLPHRAAAVARTALTAFRWDRPALSAFLRDRPAALAALRFAAASQQRAERMARAWLEPDEFVVGLAGKHPILLARALLLPALLLALAAGLAWLASAGGGAASGWLAVALAMLALALGVWQTFDWSNDHYIVTNQRAVWLEKVVALYDSRHETPLRMVLAVDVRTELLGRMLDYGDVLIRTYTGEVVFRAVPSPRAVAALIEEHWRRIADRQDRADREAILESLQQRLTEAGEQPAPPEASTEAPPGEPAAAGPGGPRQTGLDHWTLQVRFEQHGVITYRKHWAVLLRAALLPSALVLAGVGLLGALAGGLLGEAGPPAWAVGLAGVVLPGLWWLYRYADWANDLYQVTPDQIIAVHKKPLASEDRKVAPLENILGTEVDRKGLVGLLLNFGDVIANVGATQFIFRGVFDPGGVQSDVVRSQQALLARRQAAARERRREEMVEWLGTYHDQIASRRFREADPDQPTHGGT